MAKASLRAVDAGGIFTVPHGGFVARRLLGGRNADLPSNADDQRQMLTPLDAFWSTAKEMTFSSMNTYASIFFRLCLELGLATCRRPRGCPKLEGPL